MALPPVALPSITVTPTTPSGAAQAYARTATGGLESATADSFGNVMQRALESVVESGHQADAQAMQAISGTGSITDVVSAVSKAELALQTTVTIRDRVVQAYQDIMRRPI